MNAIDIFILIPVLWGFIRGYMKGVVMAAATFAAFFLGAWGGLHLSEGFAGMLRHWTGSTSPYIPLISFALVFVVILMLVFGVAKLVEKMMEKASLGFLNKLSGGLLGTLKYLVILSFLFFAVDKLEGSIDIVPKNVKEKSLLYKPVASIAPLIIPGLRSSSMGINFRMPENLVPDSVGMPKDTANTK